MLRVECNNNEGKYYFLYVTDEVHISTDDPDSFNHGLLEWVNKILITYGS